MNDSHTGLDLIELLIFHGADIDANHKGHTALHLAESGSIPKPMRGGNYNINVGRYAARLLRLILMEIPRQIEI